MSSVRSRSAPPTRICRSLKTAYAQISRQSIYVRTAVVNHTALDLGLIVEVWREKRDDQATEGTRWMPRRQEAKKDVASHEKTTGAPKQAFILQRPNGEHN